MPGDSGSFNGLLDVALEGGWRIQLKPPMGRYRLAQIGLAVSTTLLCLVAIDRIVVATFPLGNIIYRFHPEQLYEYTPGASKFFIHLAENGGDWIRVEINSTGQRGEEIDSSNAATRIVVYGDSFVAAEFSPLEESYVFRVGEILTASTTDRVESINAGLVGAGPDQMARRIEADLPRLRPDAIVLAVNAANDFGDLVRNRLYRVSASGRLVAESPGLGPLTRRALEPELLSHSGWGRLLRAARQGLALRLQQWRSGPEGSTQAGRPVAGVLIRSRWIENRNRFVRRDPVVRNLFNDSYDADLSLRPNSRFAKDKKALMAAVLGEIHRIVSEAGVPLLIVVIPSPIDVTEDHYGLLIDWRRFPDYDGDALSRGVVEPALALGLAVVDLTDSMRSSEAPSSLFFRAGNDHWNARGQELGARMTAERILELGWIEDPD
ncbi:MAG: hypothetical protein JRJ58_05115 [Deltaproteobacteria bacterium]|nr:hypothetical protein [Deltaproteobacteria bacterium]